MGKLRSLDEEVVKLEPRFAVRNPFKKHVITLRSVFFFSVQLNIAIFLQINSNLDKLRLFARAKR